MFTHLTLGTNDVPASKKFYDATFTALGAEPGMLVPEGNRVIYFHKGKALIVLNPINGEPATFANGFTVGIECDNPEQIQAWHDAGVANGGTTAEDPPGLREGPMGKMYLAYLRDPSGNKLCAIHRPA